MREAGVKKRVRLLAIAEALLLALILGSTLVVSRLTLNGLGPTAFWSWLFLGERLQIFAMVVVIGGVALVQVSRHREAQLPCICMLQMQGSQLRD